MRMILKIFQGLLPVLILGVCASVGWWLLTHPPEQEQKQIPTPLVRVDGMTLKTTHYDLRVRSQGTVQPRTRSTLLPEVSGRIIEISPAFRPGGFFAKDEVLLRLDPLDYETAIVTVRAEVAQAEALLAEEEARAEQAHENWKALGRTGDPSPLVSRAPQVAKARADAAAAKARLLKAQRDLERTQIRAPYAGQVLEQAADVGQFVGQGTTLGRVFAVDYVEIRLPLPERESRFLKLPQAFQDGTGTGPQPVVVLKSQIAGKPALWQGRIVRVESALDTQTRQTTAVAQVDAPYARRADGSPPLVIGAFVEAEIHGDPLENVFVIPRQAVRAGNEIILITAQNTLKRMTIDPMVGDEKHIVVAAGVPNAPKEGDVLCLTPIPFPADGARVLPTIDGRVESSHPKGSKPPDKKPPVVSQKRDT